MNERTRNFWYVSGGFFMFVGIMGSVFEIYDCAQSHQLHAVDYFEFPVNIARAVLGYTLFRKFGPPRR